MPAAQAAAARELRERRRNVLLLYVLSLLSTTSNGSMTFVLPLNLDRLGHPLPLVGTIVALIGLGSLLSRVSGGAWYQLARGRWLTMASFALMGCSTIALGLNDIVPFQAVFACLHGFSFGLATTFLLALLIDIRPPEDSAATTMSWYTSAIAAGYALSALLGAQSIESLGYGPAFFTSGLVALAAAVLTLTLRLPREAPPPAAIDPHVPPPPVGRLRTVLSLPAGVWLGTLLIFYLTFMADTHQTYYPIYAVGIGISVGTIGLLKVAHSIASTGVRFAGAGLFQIVPVAVVNHTMTIVMALALISLPLATSDTILVVLFVILGTCRGLLRVTSATMVAEERRRPGVSAGLVSGVYNAGADLADLFSPPLVGALAAVLTIPTTFTVVGIALPAIYYTVWFVVRTRRQRARVHI
ncbi:MAG TPA: MFS transporter [Chloroflexota bacterium]|nr:MFS transporter [Chloroflexota bacterium]